MFHRASESACAALTGIRSSTAHTTSHAAPTRHVRAMVARGKTTSIPLALSSCRHRIASRERLARGRKKNPARAPAGVGVMALALNFFLSLIGMAAFAYGSKTDRLVPVFGRRRPHGLPLFRPERGLRWRSSAPC